MALSLEDPETDALARQVASLTGETPTEAVRTSLRERLRLERIKRGEAILARFDALPILDARREADILGYDENGVPT